MKILIIGANGQLGTELRQLLDKRGVDYMATDSKQLDITKKWQLILTLKAINQM